MGCNLKIAEKIFYTSQIEGALSLLIGDTDFEKVVKPVYLKIEEVKNKFSNVKVNGQ